MILKLLHWIIFETIEIIQSSIGYDYQIQFML